MVLSSHIIMIRCGWRTLMRRAVVLIFLMSFMLLRPAVAAPPVRDDTVGQYQLIFRGCYTGKGKANVNPNTVMIHGDLVDENGNNVNFNAAGMKIENHRFHDTITNGGRTIIISGRVDPSGGALRKARLICTFQAVGVGFGRVAGEHD